MIASRIKYPLVPTAKIYTATKALVVSGTYYLKKIKNIFQQFSAKYIAENLFLNIENPNPALEVCVIVPARNEAENITKTLDSLRLQFCEKGRQIAFKFYEVLLLVNNSKDKTYLIAKSYQKKYPEFPLFVEEIFLRKKDANIGTVRKMLMDHAYKRFELNGNNLGIIASTDGDTIVDCNWLFYIKNEIEKGYDAVGGRILTHPNKQTARIFHLRDVYYRTLLARVESMIDINLNSEHRTHFQYFGANLAITSTMYDKCGRIPKVSYLEDCALYNALNRVDAKIIKSTKVKVFTSTRLNGRVEVGFSEQLQKWTNDIKENIPHLVPSVECDIIKFKCRNLLRENWMLVRKKNYFVKNDILAIAIVLNIEYEWLEEKLFESEFFGKIWEDVIDELNNKNWHAKFDDLPITKAIDYLKEFIIGEKN